MTPRGRILLVDFEPRNIRRMVDALETAGYEVEVARDGLAALELFHEDHPDGVLVEALLPKKSGFEVCRELKRDPGGHAVPVVMTAGVYRGRRYRGMAIHDYGCDEYLERPFDDELLLETLARLVRPTHPRDH